MPNPPQVPVRDYPSPEIYDGLIVEILDNNKGDWKPLPVGYRLDEGTDSVYAGYELVAQKTTGDYRWTQRFWCNPAVNQDVYNASTTFDGDDATKPIYTRSYVERRPWTPRARAVPLKVVLGATVTNAGSGYLDGGTGFLDVTLSGGSGTGATAQAIVYRGQVVFIRITNEGQNYTTVPTVVFPSGTAAATSYISSQTALLVKEEQGKLPKDDPRYGLYDLIARVYQTLPGATITDLTYDPRSDVWISTSKTKKLLSDITESVSHDGSNSVTVVSSEAIDALTGYEVVTVTPKSPHFDESTAILEYEMLPYQFPGYVISYGDYAGVTVTAVDLFGSNVGYRQVNSQTVLHFIRTWFVIAEDVPDFVYDDITPTDVVLNGQMYSNVLIDDMTRSYGVYVATIPATTPSFTEYYGTVGALVSGEPPPDPFAPGSPPKWIGTERVIKGGVERAGSEYRWVVKSISVMMR